MYTKRKTCEIRTWKTFISRHILHQHSYTCPISLPVRRDPQLRNLLIVVSVTSAPPIQILRGLRNFCHQSGTALSENTSQRKQETFLYEYPLHRVLLPTNIHNRTLLFGNTFLMHGRRFNY
jgi:hypothetical protein